MSEPVLDVVLTIPEGAQSKAKAVVDSGSFFTIVRQDVLPPGTTVARYAQTKILQTAKRGSQMQMIGETTLVIGIAGKEIVTHSAVCADLNRDMIIGAETMQSWDISIVNRNGSTEVLVGRDLHDPEITEID